VKSFRGKILVIRGGAIGDFILTLPVLAALREHFPAAHLEVLGYPHIAQLATAGGLVDHVQSIDSRALAGFFARNGDLAPDLVDYFSEFDLILSYLYDPDEIFQTNVRRCATGQFIAGPHRPNENEAFHATGVYLKPLERLAIFEPDPIPRLNLPSEPATLSQIALHPGSGSERKNWPVEHWAELIQYLLHSSSSQLLLVGGEAEGDRLQSLAAALPHARVRVAQSLPLAELARGLQRCSVFVGHDSGISHLAAALGLPGLLLWGETVEQIWRPPSSKMVLLRDPGGLEKLPVERVIEAYRSLPHGLAANSR
jgi:heptosyltransferase-2